MFNPIVYFSSFGIVKPFNRTYEITGYSSYTLQPYIAFIFVTAAFRACTADYSLQSPACIARSGLIT